MDSSMFLFWSLVSQYALDECRQTRSISRELTDRSMFRGIRLAAWQGSKA